MQNVSKEKKDITILCKVVDNFGDIGVVYRLAKNLHKINPNYKIRIVVSDLSAFKKICPQIKENLLWQEFLGMEIFDWNACDICRKEFIANPPQVILECFQCSRPDWLEKILFDEGVPNIVHIINIDYLTAEDYAEEFHCLKSGTRSPRVKKINFMPGFTAKTGGLILDEPFITNYRNLLEVRRGIEGGFQQPQGMEDGFNTENLSPKNRLVEGGEVEQPQGFEWDVENEGGVQQPQGIEGDFNTKDLSQQPRRIEPDFNTDDLLQQPKLIESATTKILIFSYPKDFLPIIRAMDRFCDCDKKIAINLAQGAGKESFIASWQKLSQLQKGTVVGIEQQQLVEGAIYESGKSQDIEDCFRKKLAIHELTFLSQEDWDKTMLAMDILFVRGEESLSRACLCGKPFVWNAYPQDEDYHLVKVAALLERMKPHFAIEEFAIVEKFWLLYNGKGKEGIDYSQKLEEACFEFLRDSGKLKRGFEEFARSLFAIGDFTEKLDEFVVGLR